MRTGHSTALFLVTAALIAGCGGSGSLTPTFDKITVVVHGAGTGGGTVVAPDPAVPTNCTLPGPDCSDNFDDAGGGGVFSLDANPAPGSMFVGFTGCSSAPGLACTLAFSASSNDTIFNVTATFDLITPTGVNLLANSGFESAVTVGTQPVATGFWRGDSAYAVGTDQTIAPRTGAKMLRFQRTGLLPGAGFFSSQQWQLIDVSGLAANIDAGKVQVDASAWFNRVAGDAETDTRFDIRVLTYTGTPAGFPADYPTPIDATADIVYTTGDLWQQASLTNTLPAGTRYVAVEIYAFEDIFDDAADPEFDGHYADDLSLVLTLLP